ncbi:MAG: aminotransferase class I/II-fold pyridoxal phosphate-dependent enzyme [candidate division Zixibacteria bacterium]|nr:aminotransferase class I/II-fold pyridoxal phosphate-dependent enzyme [candidate division Zixibacteria bacterium]
MTDDNNKLRDETLCARGSDAHDLGAVAPPIYLSSTFRFESTAQVADYAGGKRERYQYTRYGNPTVEAVEVQLAALEHGTRAFLFASGMAATSTWCHAFLGPGDKLVAARQLYGGTTHFFEHFLRPAGITVDRVDFSDLAILERALPGAKGCWFETPTNPTMRIVDGPAVAALCRRHHVLSAIDNTFATPIIQKPLDWGVDWVMHSATKYLGGHADLTGGVLVTGSDGDAARVGETRRSLGGILDPHAAFLMHRGIKTLALRMERHNNNALALARWLAGQPQVSRVHYPGLADHPGHAIAARQMKGFGGVVAVDIRGGYEAAARFVDHLRVIINAASLGGVESLVSLPVLTSHVHATEAERREVAVTDGTVRISVGIESVDDLKADLAAALAAV